MKSGVAIQSLACAIRLTVCGHRVTIETDDELISDQQVANPLTFIEQYLASFRVAVNDKLRKFYGGLGSVDID